MESNLINGLLTPEEYFCLIISDDANGISGQIKIQNVLTKLKSSGNWNIFNALKGIYECYYCKKYSETFQDDAEDSELAISLAVQEMSIHKEDKVLDDGLNIHHEVINENVQESKGANKRKKKRKKQGKSFKGPILYWFRRDLRLYDNPALWAASTDFEGQPIIPVFLWNDREENYDCLAAGGATKVWLNESLKVLNKSLADNYDSRIIFRKARSSYLNELKTLVEETGATDLIYTALYEPYLTKRDDKIFKELSDKCNVTCHAYHSYLLHRPEQIRVEGVGVRGIGSVQHFMRCCKSSDGDKIGIPLGKPGTLKNPVKWPSSNNLEDLELGKMPRRRDGSIIDWAKEMRSWWQAGEDAGYKNLQAFLSDNLKYYQEESSRADRPWTAIISPYLHFGELSPRMVLHEAFGGKSAKFRRKLAWRDLSYWLLTLFPDMDSKPIRPPYRHQRWSSNKQHLKAWQKGKTGYPLVDAAMRQLWRIGWLNNYMRHVVASFLISYLHITWVEGYKWFQDTLLDADVAINAMMWQNGGMSGLDHWNFVMHPVDAALTCDPKGDYVRKWVPELNGIPNEYIHCPWKCPKFILNKLNLVIGGKSSKTRSHVKTYPDRILIDLNKAREQSLADVTELRRKFSKGFIDAKNGNDAIRIPRSLLNPVLKDMKSSSYDDDAFVDETEKTILVPLITRKEFKFKTSFPTSEDNPFNVVLRGYVSRQRDEEIARRNIIDFTASTLNEAAVRQERLQKQLGTFEPEPTGRRMRRTRKRDPFTSV